MTEVINLKHAKGEYNIYIGDNLLENTGGYINKVVDNKPKLCLISDNTVYDLYGETVKKSCEASGFAVRCFVLKPGGESKTLAAVSEIYNFLSDNNFGRSDCLIALGGGVVGDITGFAAATYMRGVRYVQIPTTLLAQVDSSVGGKTGVDLPQGKNLVGAFCQPRLVLCDVSALATLPDSIYSDGIAEAVKHGCIKSRGLFNTLSQGKPVNAAETIRVICENIKIKADIVTADEFETGERAKLNFGHTVGHAIERYYNFGRFSHGEAVAIGMIYEAKISNILGYCGYGAVGEIKHILESYNLPVELGESRGTGKTGKIDKTDNKILAEICMRDKKSENEVIKFILLREIGDCEIVRVAKKDLPDLLERCEAL